MRFGLRWQMSSHSQPHMLIAKRSRVLGGAACSVQVVLGHDNKRHIHECVCRIIFANAKIVTFSTSFGALLQHPFSPLF